MKKNLKKSYKNAKKQTSVNYLQKQKKHQQQQKETKNNWMMWCELYMTTHPSKQNFKTFQKHFFIDFKTKIQTKKF